MSDSLYAKYLRERTDDQILETNEGFVTYKYINEGKAVYIMDIFVLPHLRKEGLAARLADLVVLEAKEKGAVELLGSVVPSTKNSTTSVQVLIAYGMSLHSSTNDFIVFRKEI